MIEVPRSNDTDIDEIRSNYYSEVIKNKLVDSTMGTRLCLLEPSWFFPTLLLTLCAGNGSEKDAKIASLAIELVYQGYAVHYLNEITDGDDLRRSLITGDYLYAKGLNEIKKIGDPRFVEILAELIEDIASLEAENEEDNLIFENENPHSSELRSMLLWYRMVFEMASLLTGFKNDLIDTARKIGSLVGLNKGAAIYRYSSLEKESLDEINALLEGVKSKKLSDWTRAALK